MPSIMVYLSQEAYVKLANRASNWKPRLTVPRLAAFYIKKGLEKEFQKQ